jgi:hypothetical protein
MPSAAIERRRPARLRELDGEPLRRADVDPPARVPERGAEVGQRAGALEPGRRAVEHRGGLLEPRQPVGAAEHQPVDAQRGW